MRSNSLLRRMNWRSSYLKIFAVGLITSFFIFLPFLLFDRGLFLYYGDFNVQQIPFYSLAHDVIREGQGLWNWNTDLGVNFIGSYSFYLLGSPFFWVTLLFPSAAVPYLMAPLLMLKFALTSVTGFAFIRRFTAGEPAAFLGGLMYAFSGFNLYNIFFNHFNEAVFAFPLLLIAMDELVINRRRGGFALAVALCAVINYYFFFGEVIFCVVYFFLRVGMDRKRFRVTLASFGLLLWEAVLGVLLGAVLLLPSFFAVIQNDRVSSTLSGFDLLFYGNVQRYGLILSSFFFPPDIPARPNFFPDSNSKWSSVSMWLPMLSTTGVFAFFLGRRKHWAKRLLILCFIACFVPMLNQSFSLFNYSYYARWFYMPLLIMALVSGLALERYPEQFKTGIRMTAGMVAAFALVGILPEKENGVLKWFSLPAYPERLWVYVLIAAAGLLCTSILVLMTVRHPHFLKTGTVCLCVLSVITGCFMIFTGKLASGTTLEENGEYTYYNQVVNEALYGRDALQLDSEEFFRIDTYGELDNLGMYLRYPTINAFHSIVPASTMEYYQLIGGERGVASRPEPDLNGVRGLTSVKYRLINERQSNPVLSPGFSLIDTRNGFKIYENDHFVPMGFTYDYYMTRSQFGMVGSRKDEALLQAILINDEDVDRIAEILEPISTEELQNSTMDDESYFAACDARAASAMDEFVIDSQGFFARGTLERENLVFFSVPWEEGWSATVNGEPAEVWNVNGGFVAVLAPAGEVEIRFTYLTPGLYAGAAISAAALLLLIGYLLLVRFVRKRHPECRPNPWLHRYDVNLLPESAAKEAYLYRYEKEEEDDPPPRKE